MDTSADADSLMKSAIDTLSRDVPTPKYQSVDIKPVQREIKKASKTRDESSKTIEEATKLNAEATASEKEGYTQRAAAEAESSVAEAARDAVSASKYDAFNNLLATQAEIAQSVADASKFVIAAKPDADKKLKTVQEMQAVGLLDNPLEWAYNQIQLPAAIKDYNRDAQRINAAQESIDSGIKQARDIADGAVKSVPNTTAAMASAKGKEAAAKAKILSANADENLAKINVEFSARKLAGDLAIVTATEGMTRIQLQDNQNKLQAQISAIQAADTHANRLLKAVELMSKYEDNKQMREVVLANYDRMTGREEGTTTLSAFEKMPPQIKAKIQAIGASSSYGQPYDALVDLRQLKTGDKLPETTKRLLSFLSDKEREHEEALGKDITVQIGAGKISKAEEAKYRENYLNQALKDDLNKELINPEDSKLFRAPLPSEIIGSGLVKVDSPLGKILSPLLETTTPISADLIEKQIFGLTSNKTTAGAMAAEYFKAAKTLSINGSNLAAINGINIPSGYIVYAKVGFGKAIPFDLTKPAENTRYMLYSKYGNVTENPQFSAAERGTLPPSKSNPEPLINLGPTR